MTHAPRVAVIAGGPSAEAAVSLRSAQAVLAALAGAGLAAELVPLDARLCDELTKGGFDVAFPITHGPVGEDGCLQGLLEVIGLRYVGSGVLASALAMSKPHAKAHFREAGLPVALDIVVARGQRPPLEEARRARRALGRAVVVKPASGGSAIGIGRVLETDGDAVLADALERAFEVDPLVLVEAFTPGLEVTCGVLELGAGPSRALPVTLIRSRAAEWYDFASRYAMGGSEHCCPAPFSPALTARIQELALGAFRAVGARDLARMDFVVSEPDAVTLLEVNTLPGMTATSLFPEAAAVAGVAFPELCAGLVRHALSRLPRVAPAVVPMPD